MCNIYFAGIIFIDISLSLKLILVITGFLVLIVELINSAIENTVDLIIKDIGSTAVMFSIILHLLCWFFILLN
ncbi:MAG: diacylglycerol kinase [Campylobacterales bacterium]|nr:diacylglycerol kinase [Campylobacterales bacterium]